MRDELPGSLIDARKLGPAAIAIISVLTTVELMVLCQGPELWLPFVTLVPPLFGCTHLASALARRAWGDALKVILITIGLHFLLGLVVVLCIASRLEAEAIPVVLAAVAFFFGITAVAASPILIGAGVLGPSSDLEAGDKMLGLCGAFMVILQTGMMAVFGEAHLGRPLGATFLFLLAGLAAGVAAFGIYVARAVARRRWYSLVLQGELKGWRIRHETSPDELAGLPPLFGSSRSVSAVVERVEMQGLLYRSGLVGRAVAAVRSSPIDANPARPSGARAS